MPNNRVKTTKALQSKKGKAALAKLHPHSRRAKQLTRVALRTDKLSIVKKERRKVENSWDPSLESCDLTQLHELIEDFIKRNSEQLELEKSNRRPGRPKSLVQSKLESELERESIEYSTSGIVVPDLTSAESVILLRQWSYQHSGDPSFLPRIRLIRLFKNDPTTVVEEQKGAIDLMTQNDQALIDEDDEGPPELVEDPSICV